LNLKPLVYKRINAIKLNKLSMKHVRNSFFLFALVSLVVFASCGPDDTKKDEDTPQELTIAALTGNWTLNASSSLFGNLPEAPSASVTVSSAGVSITGDLADYVTAVSFTVAEDGSLTGANATVAGSDIKLVAGSASASINAALNQVTVEFETEAARIAGTGDFKLVFDKAAE